jgi:predicted transcriptional regulator
MKLKQIVDIVEGTVLAGEADLDLEIIYGGAMDLMSDALAYMPQGSLLITGLKTSQTIRTAEMAYFAAVLYVRGKQPDREAIALAEEVGIPLARTYIGMFEACGRLFQTGLLPVTRSQIP